MNVGASALVSLLTTHVGGAVQGVDRTQYIVAPDGQRFLMIKDIVGTDQASTPASIVVVLNWFEELMARAPTK